MDKTITSEKSLGKIQYNNEIYYISKSELAIEKIDNSKLLYISAIVSHYELHGENNVQDLSLSILMPLNGNDLLAEHNLNSIDTNHPNWERKIYTNFYQFEHLLILDCRILINKSIGNSFNIELKGEVGEALESEHRGFYFEANFKSELSNKIDKKKNFFLEK